MNKHTHELRFKKLNYEEGKFEPTKVLVEASEESCEGALQLLATKYGCLSSDLLQYGGYSIVCLERERIDKINENGQRLLSSLVEMCQLVERMQDHIKKDNPMAGSSSDLETFSPSYAKSIQLIRELK